MDKWRQIIKKLLFPGPAAVCIIVLASGALLVYAFAVAGENTPIAYAAYLFSAYGLTVFCTQVIPPVIKAGKKLLRQIPYVDRYFDDVTFRTTVSVHLSMMINLLYAGMNGFLGLTEGSAWFVSLAVYYIFLSAIRLMLARYTRKVGFGENMIAEWKRYRLSGILLALMSIALGGMVILVRTKGNSFEYTGNMIYAMAFYTFYITALSIVNVIKYRRYNSPVMSAAKGVNLAAALVSMLALETAMLARFSTAENTDHFRHMMTGFTGGAVCMGVIAAGVYMAVNAGRNIRNLKSGEDDRDGK